MYQTALAVTCNCDLALRQTLTINSKPKQFVFFFAKQTPSCFYSSQHAFLQEKHLNECATFELKKHLFIFFFFNVF